MADQDPTKKQLTLDPSDITEVAAVPRRSALASIGALIGAAIGVVTLAPEDAEACRRRTGRTDSDPSDGVGRGHTGLTDSDSGDESNCGRGGGGGGGRVRYRAPRRARCTDSDGGRNADGVNRGRHCS